MRIGRVYFEVDLRCSFDGLRKILKEDKIDPSQLERGSIIVFMNRATTAVKIMAANDVLVFITNNHRRIPLEAIQHFPTYFDGDSLDLPRAIAKSLKEKLRIAE